MQPKSERVAASHCGACRGCVRLFVTLVVKAPVRCNPCIASCVERQGKGVSMKIAEVSKRYDISADTLRYYERVGLLRHVPRTESGIREYNETNCSTIEFLKCMRAAGVSIEALIEYMDLFDEGEETAPARKALLEEQRDLVRERIADLQAGLNRLNYKIANYETIILEAEKSMRPGAEPAQPGSRLCDSCGEGQA